MKLIILAAGEGVRMRPLTLNTPKPLLKILGIPIIEHIFISLPSEIDEVIIVVKYLGDKIRNYCGNEFYGRKITYIEGSPLGSAVSFLSAKDLLINEDRFLFIHGDDLPYRPDIENCLKHLTSGLCIEIADPWNGGVLIINPDGHIAEIIEKPENPPSNLVWNGVMVMTKKIFECLPEKGNQKELSLSSMIAQYIKKERVVAIYTKYGASGFSSPDDIKKVEKEVAERPTL